MMKRMPDARNASPGLSFTQIPTDLIRNPNLSAKAKVIMSILLSNKDGWVSYQNKLQLYMKEGRDAIKGSLNELEDAGYLKMIRYRNKTTKQFIGSFWAYTTVCQDFNLKDIILEFEKSGYELTDLPNLEEGRAALNLEFENEKNMVGLDTPIQPPPGNQVLETRSWKPGPNNINKNIKKLNKKSSLELNLLFEEFWKLYPKKVGIFTAQKSWLKIMTTFDSPNPEVLLQAVREQSKSWENLKYVLEPTAWLNQKRWLDEIPGKVNAVEISNISKPIKGLLKRDIYLPVIKQFRISEPDKRQEFLQAIFSLYEYLEINQDPDLVKQDSIPTAFIILTEYQDWICSQDWVNNVTPKSFTFRSKLFQQFFQKLCYENNVNVLTGELDGN